MPSTIGNVNKTYHPFRGRNIFKKQTQNLKQNTIRFKQWRYRNKNITHIICTNENIKKSDRSWTNNKLVWCQKLTSPTLKGTNTVAYDISNILNIAPDRNKSIFKSPSFGGIITHDLLMNINILMLWFMTMFSVRIWLSHGQASHANAEDSRPISRFFQN